MPSYISFIIRNEKTFIHSFVSFWTCVGMTFLLKISYPCYGSSFNLSHIWVVASMRWTWWDKDWRYSSHVWSLRKITTILVEKIRNTHQVISSTLKYSSVVQKYPKETLYCYPLPNLFLWIIAKFYFPLFHFLNIERNRFMLNIKFLTICVGR